MKVKVYECTIKNHWFPIVAWLIKLIQGTDFSHYAIGYIDGVNTMVLDATSKGVYDTPLFRWLTSYRIINSIEIELNTSQDEFLEWVSKQKGKSYGPLQLIGILLILLKVIKNNPFGEDNEKLTCNELILLMLERFTDKEYGDLDNYDLVATREILNDIR